MRIRRRKVTIEIDHIKLQLGLIPPAAPDIVGHTISASGPAHPPPETPSPLAPLTADEAKPPLPK